MKNAARFLLFALLLSIPLVAANAQDTEKKKKKKPERFTAIAQGVSGLAGGRTVFLNFLVNRFTTDEELNEYATILKEKGQDALRKKLEKVKVGRVYPSAGTGNDIAVARMRKTEKGYRVSFVTARDIRFFELRGSTRSTDYPFGIFQIEFDEKRKGLGMALIATKLGINAQNTVVVESLGNQPFRLAQGRHTTAPKKP